MSDERRRRIEREWASGDLAAGARHLLERVRAGDLRRASLELAAYAGHSAALLALDQDPTPDAEAIEPWVRALAKWGDDVLDCAETGAADLALETLQASPDATHQALIRAYVGAMKHAPQNPMEHDPLTPHALSAMEVPEASSDEADVSGWYLVSRALFARANVPAAAEFSRLASRDVAALAASLGDRVLAEIRQRVIVYALREQEPPPQ